MEKQGAKAQIFLSYVREDEEKVRNLYQKLSDAGFKPWMDIHDVLPGEDFRIAIQNAIRNSHIFFTTVHFLAQSYSVIWNATGISLS